jgi:hypothetical protein
LSLSINLGGEPKPTAQSDEQAHIENDNAEVKTEVKIKQKTKFEE